MSRNGLRCFGCYAMSFAMVMAIALPLTAAQAPQPSAPPQPTATVKSSADQTTPKQDSDDQTPEYVIPSTVHVVQTPVTVFDSGGNFVYDLQKDEFKIYDNGQLQDIQGFDTEINRLSLIIVVETNDTTAPFLDSVRPLASLFSDMVMGPQGEVAVVTYNDRVHLALDFTTDGDKLDTALRGLQGRGGGMHVDDAMLYALTRLYNRPPGDRKVIIAFSDGFNIGSKTHRE